MTDTLLSGTAHAIGAFTTMQCPFGQWWRDVVVRRARTPPSGGRRHRAFGRSLSVWSSRAGRAGRAAVAAAAPQLRAAKDTPGLLRACLDPDAAPAAIDDLLNTIYH